MRPILFLFAAASLLYAGDRVRQVFTIYDLREYLASGNSDTEAVSEAIREFCDPPLAQKDQVRILGGSSLVVPDEGAAQTKWVDAFLASARGNAEKQVLVEARLLLLPSETFKALHLSDQPRVMNDPAEVARFEEELKDGHAMASMTTPSFVTWNLQRAKVAVTDTTEYVKSYEVHKAVEPMKRDLTVPVIKKLKTGYSFEGLPVLLPDGKIGCSFKMTIRNVKHPIASKSTPNGPIAQPETSSVEVESKAVVADGGTIVFPGATIDKMHVLVTVKLSIVRDTKPH